MLDKVKKNIFISLGVAAVIYMAFTVYADFDQVLSAFINFNWVWLPVILLLSFLNYLTRFWKWDYYLRILKISISRVDSLAIFMSGLIMSVTPGKMGELLKSYLVKQLTGEPISKTAPVVFVERITDFISLVLLAIVGAYVFDYGRIIVIGTGIFFILITILISNYSLSHKIITQMSRIKFISKHSNKLVLAYESAYVLLRPVPLFYMIFVSLLAWSFECYGYYLVLVNFNLNISLLWSTFIYTFSTIAGAITMLPGGLGVTDGSITFLLMQKGVSPELSVSSTFIVRMVTLWFAVLIGIISVTFYQRRFGKIKVETAVNLSNGG